MTTIVACGPDSVLPPDAGSRWGNIADGSPGEPDAGAAIDASRGDPDADVSNEPDAAPDGCESDPEGDTEATAQFEGTITDCDGEGTTVSGTLDGAGDVDYFRLETSDTSFCLEDPFMFSRSAPRMCLYLDCPGLSVTCDEGAPAQSPAGLQGCCGVGRIDMTTDCSGATDEPDFYIEVSGAEDAACVRYDIDVNY